MKNFEVPNVKLPINTKDILEYEKLLTDTLNEPAFDEINQKVAGPDTGLEYDDKTGKLNIVPGWHEDADGNIVRD